MAVDRDAGDLAPDHARHGVEARPDPRFSSARFSVREQRDLRPWPRLRPEQRELGAPDPAPASSPTGIMRVTRTSALTSSKEDSKTSPSTEPMRTDDVAASTSRSRGCLIACRSIRWNTQRAKGNSVPPITASRDHPPRLRPDRRGAPGDPPVIDPNDMAKVATTHPADPLVSAMRPSLAPRTAASSGRSARAAGGRGQRRPGTGRGCVAPAGRGRACADPTSSAGARHAARVAGTRRGPPRAFSETLSRLARDRRSARRSEAHAIRSSVDRVGLPAAAGGSLADAQRVPR